MENNNKRRTLPSFPEHYVTLLHLQERWIKTQQEIQNNEQQFEPKPEAEAEPKLQEQGRIGDVRKKLEVDVRLSIRETADKIIESDGVKTAKRKWQSKKWKKSKSEARAREAAEDVDEVAAGEARAPQTKEASVELRNGGRLTIMLTDGGRDKGKEGPETKPEGAVCLVGCQITDKKGETWKPKKNQRKKEWKKRDEEEVAGEKEGPEKKPDTDKKGENKKSKKYKGKRGRKKLEEEVAGGKAHAEKTSDEKEESEKSGNAVVAADRTVEIEGRLKDMSIKGGGERGNDQPARSNNGGRYRGGNRRFDSGCRHEEWNPRNAGMIWVKKGDTSSGNAV